MADGPQTIEQLLARAAAGDGAAWGSLLAGHQERLLRVISFRLDPRLRGRIDAHDVLQETFVAANVRRAEFFAQFQQPLFLWLRWMVGNKLLELHRHHLGAQIRDAKREAPAHWPSDGSDGECGTRAALVEQLTGSFTGPATAADRAEVRSRLHQALGQMEPNDREVLALRHYEQLTSSETAQLLGIHERAAAKRYTRALERLREILAEMPGGLTELRV
jgi:RNA polymerase sigma-70 factor (ECF subfamily)